MEKRCDRMFCSNNQCHFKLTKTQKTSSGNLIMQLASECYDVPHHLSMKIGMCLYVYLDIF
jgi:hypothetical protein